uniref:Glycosyltransferase 8 domain containing 2 n=1 Tax=Oncorhynchus mykiss TaxID=8022 RepID=A0A8C7VZF7_ONCMY
SLCCVTVNHILLMMLVLIVCLLLHSKLFRAQTGCTSLTETRKDPERAPKVPVEKAAEGEDDIPVVIYASVFFYIVTLRDSIKLTRQYIEKTTLKGIKYKLLEFNPMLLKGKVKPDSSRPDMLHPLNFVRFYLPLLDISHKRVIYLDDVIVDIKDLYHTKLEKGRAAAFATDCDLPSTHEMVRSMGMQDNVHGLPGLQEVRDLGINPSDCSFNPGVFVADIGEWKKQKITKQLEKYSAMAGGVATPPMLTVFHDKYAIIDPLWHVRHLGWSPDARNSETFLQGAHLLHWNSRFKPWDYPCVHLDRWEKWFIPDPTRKFLLVRLEGKI